MEFDGSRGRLYDKRFTRDGVTRDTVHGLTKNLWKISHHCLAYRG